MLMRLGGLLGALLVGLVGVWSPPSWLRWIVARFGVGLAHGVAAAKARPLLLLAFLSLLGVLGWGSVQGHRWWKARPVPVEVSMSVRRPRLRLTLQPVHLWHTRSRCSFRARWHLWKWVGASERFEGAHQRSKFIWHTG